MSLIPIRNEFFSACELGAAFDAISPLVPPFQIHNQIGMGQLTPLDELPLLEKETQKERCQAVTLQAK